MTVKDNPQTLPIESIKSFSAMADLRARDALLTGLGLTAADNRWTRKDDSETFVVFSAHLFGAVGNLTYISSDRAAELLFLIGDHHAPIVTRTALESAFPALTLQRSRAPKQQSAGAYVARENAIDIIFVSDEIDADPISVTGIFFRTPSDEI